MKMLIGFFLGLAMASAMAQGLMDLDQLHQTITSGPMAAAFAVKAGVGPDKNAQLIQVDKDGYVICSTERKP